jgi:elongation factor 1-gamma
MYAAASAFIRVHFKSLTYDGAQLNPRTTAIIAVAKANGLDLEVVTVDTTNPTPEFLKVNPLAKVPVFAGSDGYVLTESMAIAIYRTYHSSL